MTSSPPNLMQDMHSVQLENVAMFFIDAKEFFNKVEHIQLSHKGMHQIGASDLFNQCNVDTILYPPIWSLFFRAFFSQHIC